VSTPSPGVVQIVDWSAPVYLTTISARICTARSAFTIQCQAWGAMSVELYLGDGNDTASAENTALPMLIAGGAGQDTLTGSWGNDNLDGGPGNDYLNGYGGNDNLNGDAGNDGLYGNIGDDTLNGDSGDDVLHGDAGADTLWGDVDGDDINGDDGDDLFYADLAGDYHGGPGIDTIVYWHWGAAVRVSLNDEEDDRTLPVCRHPWGIGCPVVFFHNVHSDIENVVGTQKGDEITGSNWSNRILGGAGNDTIDGLAGDDYLDTEDGNGQSVNGGDGRDTCPSRLGTSYSSCEIR